MAQTAAQARTEKYIKELAAALGDGVALHKESGGPAPCGDESTVEHLPQGGTNPYNFVTFARADNVAPEKIAAIAEEVRRYHERAGWQITKFEPAVGGRTITDITARNPADDFGSSIEVLHPERRVIVSIGSPCLKHPPGDKTQLTS